MSRSTYLEPDGTLSLERVRAAAAAIQRALPREVPEPVGPLSPAAVEEAASATVRLERAAAGLRARCFPRHSFPDPRSQLRGRAYRFFSYRGPEDPHIDQASRVQVERVHERALEIWDSTRAAVLSFPAPAAEERSAG